MHGGEHRRIVACDHHLPAEPGLFEPVVDLTFPGFHHGYTRWHLVMNEHGDIKVSLRKGLRDVGKVHPDSVSAFRVLRIVRLYRDDTALLSEAEMVGCFGLREAHALIFAAVRVHWTRVVSTVGAFRRRRRR